MEKGHRQCLTVVKMSETQIWLKPQVGESIAFGTSTSILVLCKLYNCKRAFDQNGHLLRGTSILKYLYVKSEIHLSSCKKHDYKIINLCAYNLESLRSLHRFIEFQFKELYRLDQISEEDKRFDKELRHYAILVEVALLREELFQIREITDF